MAMAEDNPRNFRSHYYKKVGFHGVDEKRSLEILLKDEPLDLEKLCTFSQRFPIPTIYRILIWKVLLGVLPPHQAAHEAVSQQRAEQHQDVLHALRTMRLTGDGVPDTRTMLRMLQLENGCLPRRCDQPPEEEEGDFLAVVSSMSEIAENEVDAYWLAKCFFTQFNNKYVDSLPHLPKSLEHYLGVEDGRLLQHLRGTGALPRLPCSHWFSRCFAGTLPNKSLERVWDKIMSGSCKILVFVAMGILLTFKMTLMTMNKADSIVQFLEKIPQENTDAIVTKAIELWQKHTGAPVHT